MTKKNLSYTVINHIARLKLDVSMNEYAVADLIYQLSNNPENDYQGWCYASKDWIADTLGLSRRNVLYILKSLIEKELVEKHEATKHLKTTNKWYQAVYFNEVDTEPQESAEIALPVQKLHPQSAKIAPNSNTNNNKTFSFQENGDRSQPKTIGSLLKEKFQEKYKPKETPEDKRISQGFQFYAHQAAELAGFKGKGRSILFRTFQSHDYGPFQVEKTKEVVKHPNFIKIFDEQKKAIYLAGVYRNSV